LPFTTGVRVSILFIALLALAAGCVYQPNRWDCLYTEKHGKHTDYFHDGARIDYAEFYGTLDADPTARHQVAISDGEAYTGFALALIGVVSWITAVTVSAHGKELEPIEIGGAIVGVTTAADVGLFVDSAHHLHVALHHFNDDPQLCPSDRF
jgi:hypothetical protein